MSKICGIYKITSPTNNIYIGQSVNILGRFSKYKTLSCQQQPKLYRSLIKYGYENHKFEILCECPVSELNEKEKYYIEHYISFNSAHGLNLQNGGYNRFVFSDEVRKKQSETRKRLGIKPPIQRGIKNINYGKPVSEEKKSKQRKSLKEFYLHVTPEKKERWSNNLSISLKRRWENNPDWRKKQFGKDHPKSKPILQFSEDGELIKEWECARKASIDLTLNFKNISSCLHKRRNTCGGFVWEFKIINQSCQKVA